MRLLIKAILFITCILSFTAPKYIIKAYPQNTNGEEFFTGVKKCPVVKENEKCNDIAPYLIFEGDITKMKILWQLGRTGTPPEKCTLKWWKTGSIVHSANVVPLENNIEDHYSYSYTINNLLPGEKYNYIIEELEDFTGSFYSAPGKNQKAIKFMVYGDSRYNKSRSCHSIIADHMVQAYKADPLFQSFVISTGDIVNLGINNDEWRKQFFCPAGKLLNHMPVYAVPGNHEFGKNIFMHYDYDHETNLFGEYFPYPFVKDNSYYWSFDYGPAHFIMIDQYEQEANKGLEKKHNPHRIGSKQEEWIRRDLEKSINKGQKWNFMVLHEPGLSANPGRNNKNARDVIERISKDLRIDMVLAGHNHNYARIHKNNVIQLTIGGGGANLRKIKRNKVKSNDVKFYKSIHHFCKIEIDGNILTGTTIGWGKNEKTGKKESKVIDRFTIKKNRAETRL